MADDKVGNPGKGSKVEVFTSTRMPDPAVPDDVIHGKRFTDPRTGEPASIEDILVGAGLFKPRADASEG